MSDDKRFYVTNKASNGTRDLIITDEDGQIIKRVNGLNFAGRAINDPFQILVTDGESVFSVRELESCSLEQVIPANHASFSRLGLI